MDSDGVGRGRQEVDRGRADGFVRRTASFFLANRWTSIAAVLLFLLLFLGGPQVVPLRSFGEFWNLGHILAFALWTWLGLQGGAARRWSWQRQAAVALGAAFGIGLLTEGLQVWFRRSPDLGDLGRDLLGALLALAFLTPRRRDLGHPRRRALQCLAALALGVTFIPLAAAGVDDLRSRRDFPLLGDFESSLETGRWEGGGRREQATGMASHGDGSLRVDFTTERYSGVYLKYFQGDWRGFRTLRFDVFNPGGEPVDLHLRIDDRSHRKSRQRYHDRFNRVFTLAPGWNFLSVDLKEVSRAPRGRTMDLGRIARVGLFSVRLPESRTIYLDHLRLEP